MNRAESTDGSFVLILHGNMDFVRDVSKKLRSKGLSCYAPCQIDLSKLLDLVDENTMIMIDIDIIERYLRILRRLLRSKRLEERFFFVNANYYQKCDWAKVNTYCEMISLQYRLSRVSRHD